MWKLLNHGILLLVGVSDFHWPDAVLFPMLNFQPLQLHTTLLKSFIICRRFVKLIGKVRVSSHSIHVSRKQAIGNEWFITYDVEFRLLRSILRFHPWAAAYIGHWFHSVVL